MAMNKSNDGRVNSENIGGAKVPRKSGLSKDAYGLVNSENIRGAKVPRKSGVSDERLGKSLGTRDIRAVGGQRFNYVNPKGRK